MLLSDNHPEESRLAMSVPANKPDTLTRIDRKSDFIKKNLSAV
jgi:hypothetical protein